MFTTYPSYPQYRSLQYIEPIQQGEDVYGLQVALNKLGAICGVEDGYLGPKTGGAIKTYQKSAFLTVDGKAGGMTQQSLAMGLAEEVSLAVGVPIRCFLGQIDLESSFRFGSYSPRRSDGSYDAGVVQRNTNFTRPAIGFNPVLSIRALGDVVRKHYDLFEGVATTRRWGLAQGAWNAPAFACYIARQEGATKVTNAMVARPTEAARQVFEAYVTNASAYLKA